MSEEIYVKVTKNGPYLVYGKPNIVESTILSEGNNISNEYVTTKIYDEMPYEPVALCRCGKSKNPPFCDNSHSLCCFDGEETAGFAAFLSDSKKYSGKDFILIDNEKFCALARFCDAYEGVWDLIYKNDDFSRSQLIKEVGLCPSGRLLIYDKNGHCIEPNFEKSISIIEDKGLNVSGPIWLKGGIRIESVKGISYEIRNRQTICRCGNSKNKPFCDCSHWHTKFKA